jgi:hypothetical protein
MTTQSEHSTEDAITPCEDAPCPAMSVPTPFAADAVRPAQWIVVRDSEQLQLSGGLLCILSDLGSAVVSVSAALIETMEMVVLIGTSLEFSERTFTAFAGNFGAAELGQLAAADLRANCIGVAAGTLVVEYMIGVSYLRGVFTFDEFRRHSITNAIAGAAGIGGGAIGCAVGTLVCPGPGATVGALLGSLLAAHFAPKSAEPSAEHQKDSADEPWMVLTVKDDNSFLVAEEGVLTPLDMPSTHSPLLNDHTMVGQTVTPINASDSTQTSSATVMENGKPPAFV